ncbi:arylamine N-acetyltransferase [Desulfopila sp. IMCC35008]|uniref:arylamine N-acetyltransferase family protein n=1 Tax=Desulfopila sp. IMCC35008 TaxID=2653858 RepID=UPI002714AB24|nr:arylamine N-acetyltransferase [Desulfopila sp. IMCC35008]
MKKRSDMVQTYLRSLGLTGRELDFSFLNDVVVRHVGKFAFSSVGCQLGEDLPLDFESLFQRIFIRRRGGYCFEQNGFLYEVLEELGFSPKIYLARVIYNQNIHPGLTHRITMVEHKGQQYVLDVGFGPLGPGIPVPMSGIESNDRGNVFRVAETQPGEYHMQVMKDGEYFSLYRFELSRYGQADCELGHFYSHRHPDAVFVNHLVVSVIHDSKTMSLRDLEYWIISKTSTQNTKINDSEHLYEILVGELGVQITEDESCQLYEKLSARQGR